MDDLNDLIKAAKEVLDESPDQGVQSPAIEEVPVSIPEIPQQLYTLADYEEIVPEPAEPVPHPPAIHHIPANSAELVDGDAMVTRYEPQAPSTNVSQFQKFGDLPTHLREGIGTNPAEILKLNLAVAIEALERASQAHENFPSPDAGFAVQALSDQVAKLTKDLNKVLSPEVIMDALMEQVMEKLTREIVQDLATEMKALRTETSAMILTSKHEAYVLAFNEAVNRMGPALKERLDLATTRIARVLNIKEKPNERGRT